MSQLALFPTHEPRPTGHGLFLAVFPTKFTAHDIYGLASKIRDKHRLIGSLRPLHHLHVSLSCFINVSEGFDRAIQLVDRACQAIANATPPFEVTFDRVLSFRGKPMEQPLVLVGSKDGNAKLKAFHRLLVAKLSGRSNANPKFNPHMTLLYGREISEESVRSMCWEVREVVLVRSHVGETKYDRLGCWKLGA